ncbi:MAG: hypothetical protein E7L01_02390 [Paenibacillus macerans]|uniref:Uncharacterized protein n=1 Tax=Paenibacillus macerans TaxID=44252 RepID=A0A090ZP47_PAEMA|nr:hypothetical protein [Paenibacillus macerans]KFN12198.1 hypothetical protein DJ90_1997 [Paenibacillus macerans]MCY7558287.1 hypothetical protein [Paenibacillus macerans]MDU7472200.1 hypothetical protein [Paenibacillus macerans]MEC0150273.1 hypothetical protein [Paenibacillus macerans]MEC0332016.1 hypothetical protein [Paenibacillus macerans]
MAGDVLQDVAGYRRYLMPQSGGKRQRIEMDNGGEIHSLRFRQFASPMNQKHDAILNDVLHVLFKARCRKHIEKMILHI